MIKVIFPAPMLDNLMAGFRSEARASFALVLARPVRISREQWRFLVQSIHIPEPEEREDCTGGTVRPALTFRLRVEERARAEGWSVIHCHYYPVQSYGQAFPPMDEAGQVALATCAARRVPRVPHLSLVIDATGIRGCASATTEEIEVWEIGQRILRLGPSVSSVLDLAYDRQVRAFGEDGQRAIQALRVGFMGLGGTGSVAVQQLAHLGVRRFLLIDPDVLDPTSLNRVVGATPRDIGRAKVLVAKRTIRRIAPTAAVEAIRGDVLMASIGRKLRDVDFVFCCTDSEGSRYFLNQLAYQYLIPCLDMGVVIGTHDGAVTHMDARVQMLAPGLSCLVCRPGILSLEHVRWDLSSDEQQKADPYFLEQSDIQQPSVISLNSTGVSLAVTMFLGAVTGIPAGARSLRYRGLKGDVRLQETEPHPGCIVCSTEGNFAAGDSVSLPSRVA